MKLMNNLAAVYRADVEEAPELQIHECIKYHLTTVHNRGDKDI